MFGAACILLAGNHADAQVTFSFEELALDGSNIDTSGVQVIGDNASGDDVVSNGVDWSLNAGDVTTPGGGIGDRNNPPGAPDLDVPGGAGESFAAGSFATVDAHFDPTSSGSESGLHDAIESILFGGSFDVTLTNLNPGDDYRVQIISWDAAVEGEGDGAVGTTKEYRYSTISSGADSLDYNQFVVDGTPLTAADGLFGNSSDEITAALITAEFTASSSDITFTMAVTAGSTNDNAIYNALVVHNLSATPVPEPSSAMIAVLGMLAAFCRSRRS